MQILCNDIGRGTQDILLYDSEQSLENCSSLIMPSPVAIRQRQLERAIMLGKTPLFYGTNAGGFSLSRYIGQIKSQGRQILVTPAAARSFNDSLEEVQAMGVKLISEDLALKLMSTDDIAPIRSIDLDMDGILNGLGMFGVQANLDGVAVAVQDHGEAPEGVSDRRFRFQHYRQTLEAGKPLTEWIYPAGEIPACFTRMRSVAQEVSQDMKCMVMDTGPAALLGCLEDKVVAAAPAKIIINVGNGHTLAAYLQDETVIGLWEHHTGKLDAGKVERLVDKLIQGDLQDRDVFDDGGHGAYLKAGRWPMFGPDLVCVTGPKRGMLQDSGYYMVNPHGHMMLTGAYGLLRAYKSRFNA